MRTHRQSNVLEVPIWEGDEERLRVRRYLGREVCMTERPGGASGVRINLDEMLPDSKKGRGMA
jgi:hypothetical protein